MLCQEMPMGNQKTNGLSSPTLDYSALNVAANHIKYLLQSGPDFLILTYFQVKIARILKFFENFETRKGIWNFGA
jgi:hypothetical protein